MSTIEVNMDEILKEIEKLSSVDGFTSNELAQASGRRRSWATELLARLIEEGKAKYVGKRKSTRIDGIACWAPVYKFIPEEER